MFHRPASWLLGLALFPAAGLAELPPPPPIPASEAARLAGDAQGPPLREALAPTACPTGTIPSFVNGPSGCDGSACSFSFTWGAPSGADETTVYEVLRADHNPDYCAPVGSYSVIGTTSQKQFGFGGLGTNRVFATYVRVKGCSVQTEYAIVGDSYLTAPGPTSISAAVVGQQVQVTLSRSDARTFGIFAILRLRQGDASPTAINLASTFQNYCPVGSQKTFLDTPPSAGTYTYFAVVYGNLSSPAVQSGPSNAVTVVPPCTTPSAPGLTAAPSTLFGGQGFNASWSIPSGLQSGSTYTVETSRSATFTTVESSVSVATNSTVIPLPVATTDYDLYVRVKAVQPCGTSSAFSGSLKLTVRAAPASFLITKAGPAWTVATTEPPPSALVSFRNVGSQRGTLQLRTSAATVFFDVSPTSLDLAPGQEASVTLTARASALATAGVKSGSLTASGGSAGTLSTPVSLTVTSKPTPAGSRSGSKVRANVTTVTFTAAQGNPQPRTIQLTLDRIVGNDPLYLSPSIGPGGAWLSLSNELSAPVPSSRTLNLTLSVDRNQQSSADGAPPYRTLLSIAPVGGSSDDAAVIEVIDQVPVPVGPGAGGRGSSGARSSDPLAVTPPTTGSFIIPATVKGTGANDASFFTDGWLRNIGIGTVPVELYYTPAGKDGLADPSVLKATTSVGPGVTLRLADLLGALFQVNGSGQVELRSGSPGGLTLRTTVEAVTGGDPSLRFGTEIPTVSYGTGTGLNQGDLVLPGISDDASNRCNLIVAETTGAAATVEVELRSAVGDLLGKLAPPLTVPPYGQAQVNGVVKAIAPGLDLTGGWLAVRVTAGSGKIVPLATVIDNRSNSFSAVKGSLVSAAAAREPAAAPESPDATVAAATYIVPAAVKANGANGSVFTSSLRMVNGTATPATLTLTYQYEDLDAGGIKTAQRNVTLGPRAALAEAQGKDFLTTLLGVPGQSRGWVKMEGDVARITAVAAISTLVDPQDPGKGVKTAQVNGFLSDVPEIMALGQTERRFAGMEKTVSKRTNLILVETSGQPATVRLRAYSAAGQILAERSVDVAANQYYQINDFFSDAGVKLGEGPFQNVEVAAQIVAGAGRIVGIATVNDNISKNPEVFVLKDAGPPAPSIGF